MVPTTMGRASPAVTSVWPPDQRHPERRARLRDLREQVLDLRLRRLPFGQEEGGQEPRRAARPRTATSLALTCSAYQPAASVANVMGSVVTTR